MPRSRLLLLLLAAAVCCSLLLAPGASADLLTPEDGGSPNADEVDELYKVILALAVVVFIGVEGALLYSLFKFRQTKAATAAQIKGNTRLEIGWTVGAALVLAVLSVITFIKLPAISDPEQTGANGLRLADGVLTATADRPEPPDGRALNICVNGQQYVWRYTYPDQEGGCSNASPFAYETMVVPQNTTVVLQIRAQDVAHSWWIPKLGGKQDAVPGHTNYAWFKAERTGTYEGQCAELCGRGHANMLARVCVAPVSEYERWVEGLANDIALANQSVQRERAPEDGEPQETDEQQTGTSQEPGDQATSAPEGEGDTEGVGGAESEDGGQAADPDEASSQQGEGGSETGGDGPQLPEGVGAGSDFGGESDLPEACSQIVPNDRGRSS